MVGAIDSSESVSVLIVDDDAAYCELLAASLMPYGYRVVVANCGATALELADQAQVALIDMFMPGLSGLETIPLLRSSNPSLQIIASSGSEEALFRAELDQLEVQRFLAKPFRIAQLVEAISACQRC